jgi:hypothetical protein
MREVLTKTSAENYWNVFRNFIWYKNSVLIEGGHPMIHGFFRLKDRKDRRPGFAVESRLKHFTRRLHDWNKLLRGWLPLLLEMEELWLQTRKRSDAEITLLAELRRYRKAAGARLRMAELRIAHVRARVRFPEVRVPSRLTLLFRAVNFGLTKRITDSRADLQHFWNQTRQRWRQHQVFKIYPHRVALNMYRDARLLLMFAFALMRARET